MRAHVIVSPKHGELQALLEEHAPDVHGRTWTARLAPAVPRLEHLIACHGTTPEEALEVLTAAMEQYDAHGMVPRAAVREG